MNFLRMADIVPEGSSGNVQVKHRCVSKKDEELSALRSIFSREPAVRAGTYTQLIVCGGLMMSDTDFEKSSNLEVVRQSKGSVLIAGLGIGLILCPILAKSEVKCVTVIEKYHDVIQLVEPALKVLPGAEKLEVIEADILDWNPPRGARWDTIYFDIWPDICSDNLPQMQKLHRRFGKHKTPGAWMGSWQHSRLLLERRREARQERRWGR